MDDRNPKDPKTLPLLNPPTKSAYGATSGDADRPTSPRSPRSGRMSPKGSARQFRKTRATGRLAENMQAMRRDARATGTLGTLFKKSQKPKQREQRIDENAVTLQVPQRSMQSKSNSYDDLDQRADEITAVKPEHSWLYSMVNHHSKKPQALIYKWIMSTLIFTNLLIFVFSTVKSIRNEYKTFFKFEEAFMSYLFLVDYLIRFFVCIEGRRFNQGPIIGRVRYFFTWSAMIDLVSFMPYFLELLGKRFPALSDLPDLTFIRIFRVFRILKTHFFSEALFVAYRVLYFNSEILLVAFGICIVLMFFTSVLLFYTNPGQNELEDGTDFASIPDTMYLSIMMLTGQGQPEGDLPWYTKVTIVMTSIFSVALFAIPASMLTWGFEAEAERLFAKNAKKRKIEHKCRQAGLPIPVSDSSDSDTDSETDSDWEEYAEVVVGSEYSGSEGGEGEPGVANAEVVERLDQMQESIKAIQAQMDVLTELVKKNQAS